MQHFILFFVLKSFHSFFRPSRTLAFKGNVVCSFLIWGMLGNKVLAHGLRKFLKFVLDQSKQVLDSFHGKQNHSLILLCKWRRKIYLLFVITRCPIPVVQIENCRGCRYFFCNGLHKKRFTVTTSRTRLATSNKNGCRNIDQKSNKQGM